MKNILLGRKSYFMINNMGAEGGANLKIYGILLSQTDF
jgi:hypothetical protein